MVGLLQLFIGGCIWKTRRRRLCITAARFFLNFLSILIETQAEVTALKIRHTQQILLRSFPDSINLHVFSCRQNSLTAVYSREMSSGNVIATVGIVGRFNDWRLVYTGESHTPWWFYSLPTRSTGRSVSNTETSDVAISNSTKCGHFEAPELLRQRLLECSQVHYGSSLAGSCWCNRSKVVEVLAKPLGQPLSNSFDVYMILLDVAGLELSHNDEEDHAELVAKELQAKERKWDEVIAEPLLSGPNEENVVQEGAAEETPGLPITITRFWL